MTNGQGAATVFLLCFAFHLGTWLQYFGRTIQGLEVASFLIAILSGMVGAITFLLMMLCIFDPDGR